MGTSEQTISIQPGYLLVERPHGYKVVLSEQPAEFMKISAACREAGCRKVLILGQKTRVSLSTLDIYELGEKITKMGLQTAIVESHDASSDDVGFLETVVFNRGGTIQFFDNEQDAKNWLEVS